MKQFIKNIGTILVYAIIGTIISIFFISSLILISTSFKWFDFSIKESIAFAALISATDPVMIISAFKDLNQFTDFHQIVFGESIMNDAVSIVFYEASLNLDLSESLFLALLRSLGIFSLVLIGSICLGYLIGFITALILKLISPRLKNKIESIEIGFMTILPWVSYLVAQMLKMSGIVAIMFNGLAHAIYTKPNLTNQANIVRDI